MTVRVKRVSARRFPGAVSRAGRLYASRHVNFRAVEIVRIQGWIHEIEERRVHGSSGGWNEVVCRRACVCEFDVRSVGVWRDSGDRPQ